MIKNIVFDFGDVFINLDKQATYRALELYKGKGYELPHHLMGSIFKYEIGDISTDKFVHRFADYFNISPREDFVELWNSILLDFPIHRLVFLKELAKSKKFRLFLLSNTNELHINWIKKDWGMELYNDFKNCFEKFYLSHEINLRKPNEDIYQFVLNENNLKASETLFIDDTKENTDAAEVLGIKVWNLNPENEEITQLLNKPFYQ